MFEEHFHICEEFRREERSPRVGMAAPLGFMSMTNPNPAALAWGVPGGCLIFHYQHGHWNGYEVCPSLSPIP
jgi:hypothetical protein